MLTMSLAFMTFIPHWYLKTCVLELAYSLELNENQLHFFFIQDFLII